MTAAPPEAAIYFRGLDQISFLTTITSFGNSTVSFQSYAASYAGISREFGRSFFGIGKFSCRSIPDESPNCVAA
jgi:hypothetical protein